MEYEVLKGRKLENGTYEWIGQIKDTGKNYRLEIIHFWESRERGVLGSVEYSKYMSKEDYSLDDCRTALDKKITFLQEELGDG